MLNKSSSNNRENEKMSNNMGGINQL